jgi:hypothetical protein
MKLSANIADTFSKMEGDEQRTESDLKGQTLLPLKKLFSASLLCIGGIKDLVPKRPLTIFAVFPFHHQAFEIAFLDELEELNRIFLHIAAHPTELDLRGMTLRRIFFRSSSDNSRRSRPFSQRMSKA